MPRYIDGAALFDEIYKRYGDPPLDEGTANMIMEIINETPRSDGVPRADYDKVVQENAELKRRLVAAIEDMKFMALAMRESDELSESCCFACICENLPDNCILPYGECPGYETNKCFEWRDSQREV